MRVDGAYKPYRAEESVGGLAHMASILWWMNMYAATGNGGDQPFGAIEKLREEGEWSDRILIATAIWPNVIITSRS